MVNLEKYVLRRCNANQFVKMYTEESILIYVYLYEFDENYFDLVENQCTAFKLCIASD